MGNEFSDAYDDADPGPSSRIEEENENFTKRQLKEQNSWRSRGWMAFTGLIGLLLLGMLLAAFAMSIYSTDKLANQKTQCEPQKVDKFSLSERWGDSKRTDWHSFSRDLQSSAHNPHLSGVGGDQIRRVMGACAAGATEFDVTGTNGVSSTITMDIDNNMIYVVDNGVSSSPTAPAARIYGVTIVPTGGCVITWSKTIQSLGIQVSTVAVPVKGNDATVGFDNPMAKVATSLVVARNETGGNILVFGDMGTGAYYNFTMCNSSSPNPCGARVYGVEATTGQLIFRSIVTEAVETVTGYLRQADVITSSAKVYRSTAWFGMSTNQSYDVNTTGTINFYARYFGVDINNGAISFDLPVNSAAQIAAGNLGSAINGAPAVDPEHDLVVYGTAHALNQSASVVTCLAAGYSHKYCLEDGMNNDQLFTVHAMATVPPVNAPVWRYSPFGADAWNQACLSDPVGTYCPTEYGPGFAYSTGPIVITNECGQTFTIAIGNSGTLYSVELGSSSGLKKWTTYMGPSAHGNIDNGISFDGKNVYFTVSNTDKKSYLTLDGTLRCDSYWAAVDAWSGEIKWIQPTPCSRASSSCPAIVADPWLLAAGSFPLDVLDFSNRGPQKNGGAVACFGTSAEDSRNEPSFGSTAIGPVVTTSNLVFAGSFSGHMHVLSSKTGGLVTSLSRCETGIVYGGASVGILQNNEKLVTYGCGYNVDAYSNGGFGSTQVKVLRIP